MTQCTFFNFYHNPRWPDRQGTICPPAFMKLAPGVTVQAAAAAAGALSPLGPCLFPVPEESDLHMSPHLPNSPAFNKQGFTELKEDQKAPKHRHI